MNIDLMAALFTLNIFNLLKILLPVFVLMIAILFIICRREMIISFLTGKPYDPEGDTGLRERRICDRRRAVLKRADRRSRERRTAGANTA